MYRLQQEFGTDIDFVHLDFDVQEYKDKLGEFGVRRRSTYVLLDANGEILQTWAGSITEAALAASMRDVLGQ